MTLDWLHRMGFLKHMPKDFLRAVGSNTSRVHTTAILGEHLGNIIAISVSLLRTND